MDAAELKTAVAQYLTKKRRMVVIFEAGVCRRGRFRADVLGINLKRNFVIVECKSCPRDYLTDKKSHKYLEYCTQAYYAMDRQTYDKVKDKIPVEWGVFVVSPKPDGKRLYPVKVVKPAKTLELSQEAQLDLSIRMCYRTGDVNRYKRIKNKHQTKFE